MIQYLLAVYWLVPRSQPGLVTASYSLDLTFIEILRDGDAFNREDKAPFALVKCRSIVFFFVISLAWSSPQPNSCLRKSLHLCQSSMSSSDRHTFPHSLSTWCIIIFRLLSSLIPFILSYDSLFFHNFLKMLPYFHFFLLQRCFLPFQSLVPFGIRAVSNTTFLHQRIFVIDCVEGPCLRTI